MDYDYIKSILRDHGVEFGVKDDPTSDYHGSYDPETDEQAVRRDHGVGFGVPNDPTSGYHGPYNPETDEQAVRRDHGVGFGVPNDPTSGYHGPYHPETDEQAVRRDHGVGFGVPNDPTSGYHGPYHPETDAQAVRRDHGASFGERPDPMEKYGTREQDILNTVNILTYASQVADVQEMIGKLPNESIKEVVKVRLTYSLNALNDRSSIKANMEEISADLALDLAIIAEIIAEERDITDFDTALFVGENDERDIIGLLEKYEEALDACGIEIPMVDEKTGELVIDPETNEPKNALDVVKEIKETAMDTYGYKKETGIRK